MINFFKNILGSSNQKKGQNNKLDDMTRIYLNRSKRNFLEVKITKDMTCQDVHIHHHNEILAELMRNNSINGNMNYNKIINANEFAFMILDDDNPYTEIKLKMKDIPHKFMKKNSVNLFYLNVMMNKKDENGNNSRSNSIVDGYTTNTINGVNNNGVSNSINNVSQQNISQEECIREGELLKYSHKHKKFDKRNVVLDKEKLIITKPKNKGNFIFLYNRIYYTFTR